MHFIYNIMSKSFSVTITFLGNQALKHCIAFWSGECRNPFKVVKAITRINYSSNKNIKDKITEKHYS